MKRGFGRSVVAAAIAGLLPIGMNSAHGAAFALIEQSASGMGNAFAGAAAVAEDASTIFFNPAGMSLLPSSEFALAGHAINLSADFSDSGSTNPLALGGGAATGGNGGDIGSTGFVPNLYVTWKLNDRWDLGLGVNAPFGLVTEYDSNWVGRFQGIKSEITTLNVNPAVSYKISDAISIGGGINYQKLDATLTNGLVLGPATEGRANLEADDDSWGWNIGAMWQLSPAARLGISYRSEIDYTLEGNATASTLTGVVVGGGAVNADVTLPDMLSLSVAFQANDRFELLADITRTGWSSINQINVVDTATGTLADVLVLDYQDAYRYSIGGNYALNDKWTLKGGLAYDETPVKNAETRTVRIPDNNRTWIAIGAQLKTGGSGRWDFGYTHIFIEGADINRTSSQQAPGFTTPTPAPGTATTVKGSYEGSVDVFSVQYSMGF